jgi:Spy/CpxP family protein refolding chaperone
MKIFFLITLTSVLAAVLIGCSSQNTQTTAAQQSAATTSTPPPAQDIRHMPVMGGMRGGY